MKRAITEAKLKCRYCQAVFIGTTRLAPEVLPPDATLPVHVPQPEMAARYHRLPKRRWSAVQAGLVLLGLAGAVVLGAWLYHYYQQRQSAVSPSPATQPAAPSTPPETSVAVPLPAGESQASPAESAIGEESVASENSTAVPAEERKKIASPVEVVECARLDGPEEASATFVGTFENHSDAVLRSVQVVVTISRQDEKIMQASSHKYEAIPPHWRGRFSADADFRFEPGMRIAWVEANSDPAPELRGCAVDDVNTDVNDDDTLHVTGEAKNATKQPLVNPVVRCDFFTRQGLYVGSALGTLEKNVSTLAPGESAAYDIHFDPKQAGSSSRLLAEPQPRLLGTTNR